MCNIKLIEEGTTFRQWIINKCILEGSPRGDLARDIKGDINFPDTYDYSEMNDYLRYKRACPEAKAAFRESYKTFIKLGGISEY